MINFIDYIFPLIESTLMIFGLNSILTNKFSGLNRIISTISEILINATIIICLSKYSLLQKFILYFVILMILIKMFYESKIYISVFFILVINYIFIISDILVANLISAFKNINVNIIINNLSITIIFSIMSKLISLVLIIICIEFFKKIRFDIPKIYWVVMDTIVLSFAVILLFIMRICPILQKTSYYNSLYILLISISILIVSGLIVCFFGKICFYYEKDKSYNISKIKYRSLEEQLAYYKSETKNINKIRHDINKNLINISYLLKENNVTESVDYIDEITKALEGNNYIVNSGNDIIDSIINYKIEICKQKNIRADIEVDHIPNLLIKPMDLTAILANLFDNAIEAVDLLKGDKRHITVKIFCFRNYLTMIVNNTYINNLNIKNNKICTNKADKLRHGYGLDSIRSSVEKYGGLFKLETSNNIFKATVLLPIEMNL